MNLDIAAISVQPIARWTSAASFLLIVNKLLGRKTLGIDPMITTFVFAEPNFMPIIVRKGGIPLAMVAIGYVGIDTLLLSVRN
jgi:hypothetical protein